jgi:hypothetical protein
MILSQAIGKTENLFSWDQKAILISG